MTTAIQPSKLPLSVGPVRIAALIKQVPKAELLTLDSDGRLIRDAIPLEMNPYCRRAVSKGCELAAATKGSCTVFTLGPPSAEDVLREAIAWGADRGVHLCDPAHADSDTLATARALAAALLLRGPFDLVLMGRNSVDGDTGQVGPELAEILDLAFVSGVRSLAMEGRLLSLGLEHDDGWDEVEVSMPAVLSVAERLCKPCKVGYEDRAKVSASRITRLSSDELGPGPWGANGSRTQVGTVRTHHHVRQQSISAGAVHTQVEQAVASLIERGAFDAGRSSSRHPALAPVAPATSRPERDGSEPVVGVVVEPGRLAMNAELLGAAAGLAASLGGRVVGLATAEEGHPALGPLGADHVLRLMGSTTPEDVAAATIKWAREFGPWAILAPSTAFGREVAGRTAAALDAGLVGDAIGIESRLGRLIASKPAFSGALVADIICTSTLQLVTVRPGLLPRLLPRAASATESTTFVHPKGRVRTVFSKRDDDVELLARAAVVVGVGMGVGEHDHGALQPLIRLFGAELAATRKMTDRGWAPRARQVGITGRAIAPDLYIGIGISGTFNHMVGVRDAQTILAINNDPSSPIFEQCDIGIVADWQEAVPALEAAVRAVLHDQWGSTTSFPEEVRLVTEPSTGKHSS